MQQALDDRRLVGAVVLVARDGGFIDAVGMQGTVWSGWLFAALAVSTMLAKKPWRAR